MLAKMKFLVQKKNGVDATANAAIVSLHGGHEKP